MAFRSPDPCALELPGTGSSRRDPARATEGSAPRPNRQAAGRDDMGPPGEDVAATRPRSDRRARRAARARRRTSARTRRGTAVKYLTQQCRPAGGVVAAALNGNSGVVVAAASAEGVRALQTVIPALPAALTTPVLVVQHRRPGTPDLLTGLLQGAAALPVRTAEDGPLQSGVTVLPAGMCAQASASGTMTLRSAGLGVLTASARHRRRRCDARAAVPELGSR